MYKIKFKGKVYDFSGLFNIEINDIITDTQSILQKLLKYRAYLTILLPAYQKKKDELYYKQKEKQADLYKSLRLQYESEGIKPTERMLEHDIALDEEYRDIIEKKLKAEYKLNILNQISFTLHEVKDMLKILKGDENAIIG